jgi:medium-chain acyl-[acyl-carrier-protein] hydrolase
MTPDNLWLTIADPRPSAAVRLICFPQAGSSAAAYGDWADFIAGDVEFCAVEYPGRGRRRAERPFVRVHALVKAALDGIRSELQRPFAVFGHCLGALVGFELLRRLHRQRGPMPLALFVAGCAAPSRPPHHPPRYTMTDEQLLAHLRSRETAPDACMADTHFAELFLGPLRRDLEAADTYIYRYAERLRCPVFVLTGEDDADVPQEEADPWRLETELPVTLRRYLGNQRFLQTAASQVLRDVSSDLHAFAPAVSYVDGH